MKTTAIALIITEYIKLQDYQTIFANMAEFTKNRKNSADQIWVLEHEPVYTHGLASKQEHVLTELPYPIAQSDRGGQITFHSPGQLIFYLMIDLKQKNISIIDLINNIENAIIATLADFGITTNTNKNIGRGVFIGNKKIAFVGLKIKNKCSYHGFSLNIDNDLAPYKNINPCGITDLELTTVKSNLSNFNKRQITVKMLDYLCLYFGYKKSQVTTRTT
jgi:lipoyl(octanoyl) transferase